VEGDQVVAPVLEHVGRLGDQLAVPPDPVAWQVGAQVRAGGEHRARRTGVADVEDRARFRVALGEQQHVVGPVGGHGDQVGLGEPGAPPGRRRRVPGAEHGARLVRASGVFPRWAPGVHCLRDRDTSGVRSRCHR
jgi:hypothetical protein